MIENLADGIHMHHNVRGDYRWADIVGGHTAAMVRVGRRLRLVAVLLYQQRWTPPPMAGAAGETGDA